MTPRNRGLALVLIFAGLLVAFTVADAFKAPQPAPEISSPWGATGTIPNSPTPAPPPAPRRDARLTGVTAYKVRFGFTVCGRAELHDCRVQWGYLNDGARGTLAFPATDIHPTATCDGQIHAALEICRGQGSLVGEAPERLRHAVCLRPYGVLVRGEGTILTDPRDEQVRPGTLRVECAEGTREFNFDDPL